MKRMGRSFVLALFLSALAGSAAAQERITIKELKEHPLKYNQRVVAVAGNVIEVEAGRSGAKTRYASFALIDSGYRVDVFSVGPAAATVASGGRVEVHGVFHVHKFVEEKTFSNAIEVQAVFSR